MVGQTVLDDQRAQNILGPDQGDGQKIGELGKSQLDGGDDFGRTEIGAHRVKGYATGFACGGDHRGGRWGACAGAGAQTSTSSTWRPRYIPLLGLTWCGRKAVPSVGSLAYSGALKALAARRLALRRLDCLRFGLAMVSGN